MIFSVMFSYVAENNKFTRKKAAIIIRKQELFSIHKHTSRQKKNMKFLHLFLSVHKFGTCVSKRIFTITYVPIYIITAGIVLMSVFFDIS